MDLFLNDKLQHGHGILAWSPSLVRASCALGGRHPKHAAPAACYMFIGLVANQSGKT